MLASCINLAYQMRAPDCWGWYSLPLLSEPAAGVALISGGSNRRALFNPGYQANAS
jgi:hypothetical protein